MRKTANSKTVNLPNGRYFDSKWERISRKQLTMTIRINRVRTIGPRKNNRMIYFNLARPALKKIRKKRREAIINRLNPIYGRVNQAGSRLGSNLLKAGFNLGTKALWSKIGKKTNK